MLKISTDYAKIKKVILLYFIQKGLNYANLRLKTVSEMSLCQIYYATSRKYARIKLKSDYAKVMLGRFKLCRI